MSRVSHEFMEWFGFDELLCRVSHEFREWLGIWRTVLLCVPRVYGVVKSLANSRVVYRSGLEFGELLCRVSHEFREWLRIWRTVVSCLLRVYGVGFTGRVWRTVVVSCLPQVY